MIELKYLTKASDKASSPPSNSPSKPKTTARVPTTFSFAKSPLKTATAACQEPKPTGINKIAMTLPIAASSELSTFSIIPKLLFSKPKLDKNHTATTTPKIMVPALTTKALQR